MYDNKDLPLTETVFYIMLALRHPNHGYGITQEVAEMTGDRVKLGPGTLYGAIQTLEKKSWIRVVSEDMSSRHKKEYELTTQGREVFAAEQMRLQELLDNSKLMENTSV